MTKKLKNILINGAIVITILIGLAFILVKPARNSIMAHKTNQYQIGKISKKTLQKNKEKPATFDFEQVQSISDSEVYQSVISNSKSADDLPVIAGIAIPELNVNLPIFKGVSNEALLYGAGTMKEDQEMGFGNYALASHNVFGLAGASKMLFAPLVNAQKGMKIYLTDKDNVFTYEISSIETVEPSATYVIDNDSEKTQVTLVTCTDANATGRIIVKGDLVKQDTWDNSPEDVKQAFHKQYNRIQS